MIRVAISKTKLLKNSKKQDSKSDNFFSLSAKINLINFLYKFTEVVIGISKNIYISSNSTKKSQDFNFQLSLMRILNVLLDI